MLTRWYDTPSFARFSSLFDEPFLWDRQLRNLWEQTQSAGAPRFDVFEDGQQVIVRGELPGLAQGDLTITAENDTLTIQGERKFEVPEGYRAIRRERTPMKFTRSFKLAKELDLDAVEAKLEHGVLTLSIPRRPETMPRQIEIKVS
jgi:HSP20 family protein